MSRRRTKVEGEDVEMSEIANIARLYAHLILEGATTLGVLKVLDLAYVKEKTGMFVELLIHYDYHGGEKRRCKAEGVGEGV